MLKEAKKYLNLEDDWSEDDEILTFFIEAAKQYVQKQIDVDFDETNALHRLAVYLNVAHQYSNREPTGEKKQALEFSLKSIINQINLTG
ncbi:hypothetical protein CHR37_06375 [Bacillus velezensis]|uniref:head-tail connector protein n=1 Tax=Bacillus TaxID=1386 RepID=UPI000397F590|nr:MULTISPECIES: head-tail connector protein [Bacillus]ERH55251.1 hypothetical protein O205_21360 [Bacillus amyloliquefaciens EGD-AQ14]MCR4367987.1 head-tail connector protein [Bacillus amyloliquefaciens]MCV3202433.1 head-tail connector protein [Bacillus velezensis]MCX2823339.1 head-tail connector protein [Bacillus sp. H1F1]MDL5141124.1 head-tail connector protein [Bacillus atrophaeus]